MRYAILLSLALCGCTSALELAYRARIQEAKAHCVEKGGDEFKPLGASSWVTLAAGGRPSVFSCVRLGKIIHRKIAIYRFRREGDDVALEIE
jgi:hypothetical protein